MKVFCVVPAYNEAKNIVRVINEIKPLLDEVVVVDDGSTDNTYELSRSAGIRTLKHLLNRGQGAALRTGTEYVLSKGADIIVHFDADGQFMGGDIEKIIAPIKEGRSEVVFGSRFLQGRRETKMPFLKRYLIMPLAMAANKIFFGINLTDPQSGFRAMSAAAARRIKWRQDRMAHCSEIMLAVKKNNLTVEEAPITVIYHRFGQSFFDGFGILKDLFIAMLINH